MTNFSDGSVSGVQRRVVIYTLLHTVCWPLRQASDREVTRWALFSCRDPLARVLTTLRPKSSCSLFDVEFLLWFLTINYSNFLYTRNQKLLHALLSRTVEECKISSPIGMTKSPYNSGTFCIEKFQVTRFFSIKPLLLWTCLYLSLIHI